MNVRLYDGSVRCADHMDSASYDCMTEDPCTYCGSTLAEDCDPACCIAADYAGVACDAHPETVTVDGVEYDVTPNTATTHSNPNEWHVQLTRTAERNLPARPMVMISFPKGEDWRAARFYNVPDGQGGILHPRNLPDAVRAELARKPLPAISVTTPVEREEIERDIEDLIDDRVYYMQECKRLARMARDYDSRGMAGQASQCRSEVAHNRAQARDCTASLKAARERLSTL